MECKFQSANSDDFGKNEFLDTMTRYAEMLEIFYVVTSTVICFYEKEDDLGEWWSRKVLLFLSSPFNKFEILDYKKIMQLGRGVILDGSK